jgi:hypothetical protein
VTDLLCAPLQLCRRAPKGRIEHICKSEPAKSITRQPGEKEGQEAAEAVAMQEEEEAEYRPKTLR